jgi:hypothetical protein
VYDLTNVNGYMYWAGVGIFHTGVEGQFTWLLSTSSKSQIVFIKSISCFISYLGEYIETSWKQLIDMSLAVFIGSSK